MGVDLETEKRWEADDHKRCLAAVHDDLTAILNYGEDFDIEQAVADVRDNVRDHLEAS